MNGVEDVVDFGGVFADVEDVTATVELAGDGVELPEQPQTNTNVALGMFAVSPVGAPWMFHCKLRDSPEVTERFLLELPELHISTGLASGFEFAPKLGPLPVPCTQLPLDGPAKATPEVVATTPAPALAAITTAPIDRFHLAN